MSARKSHKVLVLEDSDSDAELLGRRLVETGMDLEVMRTNNRASYIKGLESFAPDIIISDYDLPDLDGYAAFNMARGKDPNIPFIILSGVVDDNFASRMLKAGVTDFILKDRPERLGSAVERALLDAEERRLDSELKDRSIQLETENDELRKRMIRIRQLRSELEGLREEIKKT